MNTIVNYVPADRRQALAKRTTLADRTVGAALFADIAGFTPATEAIARAFGLHRGAEELLIILNQIYAALIAEVDRYGGSVVGFAGDSLTAWFDENSPAQGEQAGHRATACALAMRVAMAPFQSIAIPGGQALTLALKIAVAVGPVRRLLVGDPAAQLIEVLAGATVARLAAVASLTGPGEVVLDPVASRLLGEQIVVDGWRSAGGATDRCAAISDLTAPVEPQPWPPIAADALSDEQIRPWLLPPVYTRLHNGYGEFLAELRHTVSLFLQFADLDYDHDDQAGAKLDTFVRWVQEVLAHYAGWLVQVSIGDKGSYLYATFGAPIAHGDDAARAVAAALELRAPPPQLAYSGQVRIGISGGQSRAGALGSSTRTYNVMGAATNLAARLMEAAAPEQVLMSANLAPAVSRHYLLDPLPPIKVKGKAELVPLVAILGARSSVAIHLQEPQYALPLIGRRAEIALIEAKIAQALRGQGQVVSITGEAGMGKSRLVAETIRRATAAGFSGLGGAAQPTNMQTAYYAWQPIWRAFFGLSAAAPAGDQAAALEHELAALDPALLPRLPLLGMVLDLPLPENDLTRSLDTKQRKESLEGLLVDCLKARLAVGTAHSAPLLLVVEDAHWLDALSYDLLEAIGRAVAGLPALLVAAYRPADAEGGVQLPIAGLAHAAEIHLGELMQAEAAQLIERKAALSFGIQGGLTAPFIEAITARAEGNPFYIEELLNYFHDHGITPGDMAAFERLELPGSLASLILSRIDRLTAEQQTTLKVASVIGRMFPVDWLWGVHPGLGSEQAVLQDLEILARLDITPLDTPRPELSYLFKHATTQEVAYASLPFALRAQLHEQLATWLEGQASANAQLDQLAYHFGRSANTTKQREYFRKAGDAAAARFANAAAIQYYERLVDLLPSAEQAPELLMLGRLLESTSAWAAAEARYRAVLRLAEGPEDQRWRAQAQVGLGNTFLNRARYDQAMDWFGHARHTFEGLGDRAGLSETLFHMGRIYWYRGDADMTLPFIEQSLALAGEGANKRFIANAYEYLGNIALGKQDYSKAREWWLRSLALRRALNDKQGVAASTGNLAIGAFMEERYDEALGLITESVALFHEVGARSWYGFTRIFLALILAIQGDPATAQKMQFENLSLLRDLESLPLIYLSLVGLAHATQLAEQTTEASRYAVRLIGAAIKVHEAAKSERYPYDQIIADSVIAQAKQQIDQATLDTLWAEGYAMHWQQAVAYALARGQV